MSGYDDQDRPEDQQAQQARGPQPDDVGSVAEEAAKLFGAFADLARERGGEKADAVSGSVTDAVSSLAGHAARVAQDVNEHLATDNPECRYCPVCRTVHLVREATPEVRTHLITAASSLLQAAAGLLESLPPAGSAPGATGSDAGTAPGGSPATNTRGPAVEHIDLDDEETP